MDQDLPRRRLLAVWQFVVQYALHAAEREGCCYLVGLGLQQQRCVGMVDFVAKALPYRLLSHTDLAPLCKCHDLPAGFVIFFFLLAFSAIVINSWIWWGVCQINHMSA